MAINLLKLTTEKLGYEPLKPVSSVNREVNENANSVAQSVIPAVLAAMLNISNTDDGLQKILHNAGGNWTDDLFGKGSSAIIKNIASYCHCDEERIKSEINKVADTSAGIIKNHIGQEHDEKSAVKNLLKSQKTQIYDHVPVSLQLGSILNNEIIDDHTNKMQGPFSTFMHKFGEGFDKPDTDEKLDEKSRNF